MLNSKYILIFVILIIGGVKSINAQEVNPCPVMRDYQMSFSDFNLDIYDIPNINGEIIAEIPAGRRFSLSNIYPKYYDDFCWYEIVTFSVDETGWISLQPRESQVNNPLHYPDEPTSPTIASTPTPKANSSRAETTAEIDAQKNQDLIIAIYWFIAGTIGLSIIIGKLAVDLLNNISTKPSKNKSLKQIGSQTLKKIKGSRVNGGAKQKVINVTQTNINLLNEAEEDTLDSIVGVNVYSHFLAGDFIKTKNNINTNQENIEELSQFFGFSLEYCITNFNQGNKAFFDNLSRLQYLKPTENVIHGKVGNLGLGDRQEFEEGERSQASYLAFSIGQEIWLIPNLLLSRWPRVLNNSDFFDIYPNWQTPKLVKPAKLILVGDRRWQIVEKGMFN
jgi:hypothetical protein